MICISRLRILVAFQLVKPIDKLRQYLGAVLSTSLFAAHYVSMCGNNLEFVVCFPPPYRGRTIHGNALYIGHNHQIPCSSPCILHPLRSLHCCLLHLSEEAHAPPIMGSKLISSSTFLHCIQPMIDLFENRCELGDLCL